MTSDLPPKLLEELTINYEEVLAAFEEFLRGKQLRATNPRRDILRIAWASPEHFTADEMYVWVLEDDANASRATVYRTLSLLAEADFLSTMNDGKGTVLYEKHMGEDGHHDHMICLNCRKIIEFVSNDIERIQDEVAAQNSFKLTNHTLRLEGLCVDCQ
ncbi:MAG: Fur family transcriptional regulator [Planctomycetota bacterium]|nr:Fur family transcriptional regulator [Planctomycetota bacterium]